jgi:HAAS domain-containing protein
MDNNLKNYLEEIDHYLILSEGKKEILAEIETHILEKTERDFGTITEENIASTIASFGSAQQVAENYLDGFQIISPSYKNFLFRYTWILFIIHYIFKIISYAFNITFRLLPFDLSIDVNRFMQLIFEAPVTWIYDFGMVALILYLITQSEKETNLIWPEFMVKKMKIKTMPLSSPSWVKIGIIFGLLIISLFVFAKYDTLFFKTVNLSQPPVPLFAEGFSQFMSLLVIGLFFFELICSIMPFIIRTYWTNLINYSIYIVVAVFLLNYPFGEVFIDTTLNELKPFGVLILAGILIVSAYDLFRVIVSIIRKGKIMP